MHFQTSIEIARPIDVVFDYLSHQENHQEFVKENKRSEQLTEGPMGVGSRVRNTARFLGMNMVEEFDIIEFVPNQLIAKRSVEGSTIETTDRLELEETPQGTQVRLVVTGKPTGIRKLMLSLATSKLQKSFDNTLKELKRILESQPHPGA